MAKQKAVYVKCPFYSWENGIKLCCEGLVDNGFIHQIFPNKDSRLEYERKHCKCDWKSCPIAQIINQKHDQKRL